MNRKCHGQKWLWRLKETFIYSPTKSFEWVLKEIVQIQDQKPSRQTEANESYNFTVTQKPCGSVKQPLPAVGPPLVRASYWLTEG